MAVNTNLVLSIFSTLLSFLAAYYSYVIYTYNRIAKGWLAVTLGLLVAAFFRILAFAPEFGLFKETAPAVVRSMNIYVLLIISALLAYGIYSMKKNFESFDVVEKNVQQKIKKFRK